MSALPMVGKVGPMTDALDIAGGAIVSRRSMLSSLALASAGVVAGSKMAFAEDEKPQFMFVQMAEALKVDAAAGTVRLVNTSPHVLYFTDRPERIAGHIKISAYLEEWTSKAGADNFGKDPPNAALSVYEDGQSNNTLAVIEILNPRPEGRDMVYDYKIIEGNLPASGEETAMFIDWIGVGGGVGVGFHGVGVGLRGPGLR